MSGWVAPFSPIRCELIEHLSAEMVALAQELFDFVDTFAIRVTSGKHPVGFFDTAFKCLIASEYDIGE